MRHLLSPFDPTVWMVISSLVFLIAFAGLAGWVYLPSRRRYYEKNAEIPLGDERSHD